MRIIDISKYQSKIDWTKVKIDGVYIKATEGVGYIDEQFNQHIAGAKSAGIKFGFYHFATLNSKNIIEDSSSEAKSFYNATIGKGATMPFVLDIEKNAIGLSPTEVLSWIKNFFKELNNLGVTDIAIYSYTPFLNINLPSGHLLGTIKLWLAAYTGGPAPILPKGWSGYWLWQHTQKAIINGVDGGVDESTN